MTEANNDMKKYELQDISKSDNSHANSSSDLVVTDNPRKYTVKHLLYSQVIAAVALLLGLTIGVLIGVYVFNTSESCDTCEAVNARLQDNGYPSQGNNQGTPPINNGDCQTCRGRKAEESGESKDSFLFAPLTAQEMKSAYYYLESQGLVVPRGSAITRYTNYATAMYTNPPNKQESIEYLDHNGPNPGRYARVHVARGGVNPPDVMEYKVGPLNEPDNMRAQPMLSPGEINYDSRPMDFPEIWGLADVVNKDFETMEQLVRESFDDASFKDDDLSIVYTHGGYGRTTSTRETRLFAAFNGFKPHTATDFLNLLPLSFVINNPGRNSSAWRSHHFFYLNQGPYDSAQDLMNAYRSNRIRKVKFPKGYRSNLLEQLFPGRNRTLPIRENSNIPPSRTYQPGGARYTIKGHNVKWMDWELTIGNNQHRGPSLHNIKFKGQRIVWEFANNDISLTYGSSSSSRANSMYMDAVFGIGYAARVIRDVDCPSHASILETHIWETTHRDAKTKPSFCVFEGDGEEPLWRHRESSFQAGLRNNYLVVRMPCVIGNYDYLIEWHFMLNGEIKTYVTATGYLQTSYWDPDDTTGGSGTTESPFGFRVMPFANGDIHDHSFGFKVDLDVIDSSNSFDIIHWKAGDVRDALRTWIVPPHFPYNTTRFIEYETAREEVGMKIDLSRPTFWTFVNEKYKNRWGAKRGYRIIPLTDVTQVLPNVYPTLSAMAYTKYHCTVTKRKEEEQYLTSLYDSTRFDEPVGSLDDMIDGESIVNEDLVSWITAGFLHVPTSEDVPMTTRLTTGFILRPFNFFDSTASYDVQQYLNSDRDEPDERPPDFPPCAESRPET